MHRLPSCLKESLQDFQFQLATARQGKQILKNYSNNFYEHLDMLKSSDKVFAKFQSGMNSI